MNSTIRLLVRVDDAGSSWSSNIGCLRACTEGIARSIEVMMPCAWVAHAAAQFADLQKIDVGIHLTLSSEWEAVKWRPLTQAKSLTDASGNFLSLVMPREGSDRPNLAEANCPIDDIASEFKAQIGLGSLMFPNVSHVSSHMLQHFKDFDPKAGEIIADLCAEYGLMDDVLGYGVQPMKGYPKFPRDADSRTSSFIEQLSELSSGTYIFIDHPAEASPELNATGHIGYEDVMTDRLSCLATLTNNDVKQHIDNLGIELISYKEL